MFSIQEVKTSTAEHLQTYTLDNSLKTQPNQNLLKLRILEIWSHSQDKQWYIDLLSSTSQSLELFLFSNSNNVILVKKLKKRTQEFEGLKYIFYIDNLCLSTLIHYYWLHTGWGEVFVKYLVKNNIQYSVWDVILWTFRSSEVSNWSSKLN